MRRLTDEKEDRTMAGRRFEKIYSQGIGGGIDIWLDRATGVQYLYIGSGSGGGLTPLLNR